MPWPDAEVQITGKLVRDLLAVQHPDLADRPLRLVDAGFDNELWRLGDDLVVRMPRRAIAAGLIANEQRWLPELSRHLPLPVPAPVRLGQPSGAYPWPWSVVPWLPGVPGDQTPVTNAEDAGRRLGGFLAALHHPAPEKAPFNAFRSVALSERTDTFEARLTIVEGAEERDRLRDIWRRAIAAGAHRGPKQWIHGDLHPANALVEDGTLTGVIDFGDLCGGDPATDVAAIWMLLPAEGVPAFRSAYGGVEPALEDRSRGWAALFAVMLLELGHHDRPTYRQMARTALDRIIVHQPF